jgi:hypothetical protein
MIKLTDTTRGRLCCARGTGVFRGRLSSLMDKAHDEPSEVTAEEGEVIVEGPDGVAVSLTPDAAAETSHRLLYGAAQAQGQRCAEEKRKKGS